jgi:hypothetical protein
VGIAILVEDEHGDMLETIEWPTWLNSLLPSYDDESFQCLRVAQSLACCTIPSWAATSRIRRQGKLVLCLFPASSNVMIVRMDVHCVRRVKCL